MSRIEPSAFVDVLDLDVWNAPVTPAVSARAIEALESGKVLALPALAFTLTEDERRFLSPHWLDGSRKNISLDSGRVNGAAGSPDELARLAAMIERFSQQAFALIRGLFPQYGTNLQAARSSFRPGPVDKPRSWRKDDSRLHVDAFPSRPNYGERILRVFSNVNPDAQSRVWRVGEPFEAAAKHFLPNIGRPMPGSARVLHALHITKSLRSEYDHLMLCLHDSMKADGAYQANAPQQRVEFPPGSTWICYSDQVLHAAMGGQYMFEQTLHLPVSGLYHPQWSPLRVLERLTGRDLVDPAHRPTAAA